MSSTGRLHTILIVDDEERLRKALERSLRRENCQTQAAASGEEALGLLEERQIDLVITDLVLPGLDGLALVRQIKSAAPGTKVIVITAYGSAESRQEAAALGVADYLAKPFDLSYLKSRVNELLSAGEACQSSGGRSRGWGGAGAVRLLGAAAGKTQRALARLSRRAVQCVRPRKLLLVAGRVMGAVSGLWLGIPAKESNRK